MPEILQFDNFAPDAETVREAVLSSEFSSATGPDGATYTGISRYPVPHWFDRIVHILGKPITPRIACFRLNLEGELPHSWVHSDDICAEYASVLYLNPASQCQGGTAFWRHTALNLDRLPTKANLGNGLYAEWFYRMMSREWKDLTFWQQVDFVPMQFNRFITYPTCLFHSRYPFTGFGTGPQDGRLIWICFYDVPKPEHDRPRIV